MQMSESAYDGGKYSKLTNAATYSSLSDYFLEPGDFVKIDNVLLGYTKYFLLNILNHSAFMHPPETFTPLLNIQVAIQT